MMWLFKFHAGAGIASFLLGGFFAVMALNSSQLVNSLSGFLYGGQELQPFTTATELVAMDSKLVWLCFLFFASALFNGWRCSEIDSRTDLKNRRNNIE